MEIFAMLSLREWFSTLSNILLPFFFFFVHCVPMTHFFHNWKFAPFVPMLPFYHKIFNTFFTILKINSGSNISRASPKVYKAPRKYILWDLVTI